MRRRCGATGRSLWTGVAACAAAILVAHANAATIDSEVEAWLENYLEDGETRLFANDIKTLWVSSIGSSLSANWKSLPTVCDGLPSIQTKSSTITPNGGCPDVYTNASVSCTCLYGYNDSTVWEFRVRQSTGITSFPLTQKSTDTLEFSSMVTMVAPSDLITLRIVGEGDSPVTLNVTADYTGWSGIQNSNKPALITASTTAALAAVEMINIDISNSMDSASEFVPLTITNMTIRSCGLSGMSSTFLQGYANLATLDLSQNELVGGYNRISASICSANPCPLQNINLSSNLFTSIPYRLFYLNELSHLYLADNPITNYTIGDELFSSISNLTAFTIDNPDVNSYNCSNGTWQSTHGVELCVLVDTTSSSSASSSSGTPSYVWIIVAIGAALVLAVTAFAVRQRRARKLCKDDDATSAFAHTLSFDSNFHSAHADLIDDPIILTHRIPFKDVKVANCICKGGFGLVYSGVYNRRRVAIKRIRPDLGDDMKRVELFLKEIRLMAALTHPRIVEFIGVAWDTIRNLSAVTEYMDRGDLREVLHSFKLRNCALTWDTHKTHIACQVAEALTYLHSLDPKLIHRDLKSKNVLLNNSMDAKLSDFGVSRERHFVETHMTAGIGTSFWIAPEVLLGKDYDERADIFSYGIVLSEIDTDDYPYWNARNPPTGGKHEETAILRKVATGELVPEFSDSCPKAILDLAMACLQLNPEDRPTAPEVVYRLQQTMSPVVTMSPPSNTSSRISA